MIELRQTFEEAALQQKTPAQEARVFNITVVNKKKGRIFFAAFLGVLALCLAGAIAYPAFSKLYMLLILCDVGAVVLILNGHNQFLSEQQRIALYGDKIIVNENEAINFNQIQFYKTVYSATACSLRLTMTDASVKAFAA